MDTNIVEKFMSKRWEGEHGNNNETESMRLREETKRKEGNTVNARIQGKCRTRAKTISFHII